MPSSLAAHVDTLRAITYTLRRAKIEAEYSQGYNPHMELAFSPPLPLGVESHAEYVAVKTKGEEKDVLNRLNAVCPVGLRFTKSFTVNSVNLAAKLNRAEYVLSAKGIGRVIDEITADGYCISYENRGEIVTKNVSDGIFSAMPLSDDQAVVTLAIGNSNVRPDRLVNHLINVHSLQGDYSVTKTACYVNDLLADEWLSSLH